MFQQDEMETPVIFRKWKDGDVIALFPAELGTYDRHTCSSYEHVGQHGAADPRHVIASTKPATAVEYWALKSELESAPYGYRLKAYRRMQRSFDVARQNQLRALESTYE